MKKRKCDGALWPGVAGWSEEGIDIKRKIVVFARDAKKLLIFAEL